MPLSSYGLCDAEITTPASALRLRVRNAIPGVGTGPTSSTSMPMEQSPEVSALSIMYPESLVSLPITMRCLRAESRNTCAAALPMRIAISEVMGSWFATPLTPSVPKSFFICSPSQ